MRDQPLLSGVRIDTGKNHCRASRHSSENDHVDIVPARIWKSKLV